MKSLLSIFAMSAASALMLASCGNKTAGQQSSTDSDSVAAVADTVVAQEVQEQKTYEPGRGDLGGLDLRGPVKKVEYKDRNFTFNEDGQLQTENGQSLRNIFPGGVKRNKDGRLAECNADAYGSRSYTYNAQGLPTEINEDGYGRTFTYDADGYVATMTETIAPEMGDDEGEAEVNKYSYTIVEKDSYGNWTKRKDQKGNVETRKITYFE